MKNTDKNITNNIKNDVPVAGTDLFADSEDFLNELTDSELVQIAGGSSGLSLLLCHEPSNVSLAGCD
ncbi:hypothetical protein NIES4075_18570 [Tolypothrix sp. NIES-4075]|uniref:hypothetical protein n=1 Tax=Tolypothrix sp. NIES-4075 TaxID=2005459 RepID=UPI000B5D02E0|nr:hypothetical protein [Tolypothrix sp. NIES-4075]GAX40890.1 hypothetical protein NIES4075_18570 [Tolypothrix sp. NIES-4075]